MENRSLFDEVRERLPVGEGGLFPLRKFAPLVQTAWALRRSDAHLATFRGRPESRNLTSAGWWRVKVPPSGVEVKIVVMAIGIGFLPFTGDNISAAFIDEYHPVYHGDLENLTRQETIPVLLVGDTPAMDCIASVKNAHRHFMQKSLAAVSATPTWTPDEFAGARAIFKQVFPDKLTLWQHFRRQAT